MMWLAILVGVVIVLVVAGFSTWGDLLLELIKVVVEVVVDDHDDP